MVSKYGHIYEKKCLEEWLGRSGGRCPFTGKNLKNEELIPLYCLKIDIQEYKKKRIKQEAIIAEKAADTLK